MSTGYAAVVFDLDGTLIDSRKAIVQGLAHALRQRGLHPCMDFADVRIGPPLDVTLRALAGTEDAGQLALLISEFKSYYDDQACLSSSAYAGINELLDWLNEQCIPCLVATNKRRIPTRRILEQQGWMSKFADVYSLDDHNPAWPDKASMLVALLQARGLPPTRTLYVGDTEIDALAARSAGMSFAGAHWGYGNLADMKESGFATPTTFLDHLRP